MYEMASTLCSVENSKGPISKSYKHTAFHMSATTR